MLEALLYNIKVRRIRPDLVEITMIPSWLGRRFRRNIRVGRANRAWSQGNKRDRLLRWWWSATDRYVGAYIERYIEASPLMTLDEMPVEMLLTEGSDK